MAKERSPGFKLGMTVLIGALLAIPLFMVYALVWDRQSQSETARASVAEGWGGPQMLAGPVMVIPIASNRSRPSPRTARRRRAR
jgi:inner membrane protein